VGITTVTWRFDRTPGCFDPTDDASSFTASIGRPLQDATGLRIDQEGECTLCIPTIHEVLFTVLVDTHTVTVHGGIPPHPYLWENLDAIMTSLGGRRDTARGWQPAPAHARLRTRWDALSPRDRFLLKMPAPFGWRPFDRFL
jgi:hypothetical protein